MSGRHPQPVTPRDPRKIGLPMRPFLYTLDQISTVLDIAESKVRSQYIHFEGRSIGVATRDQMIARNIAPADEKPEWRVAEQEFIRWLKRKGFKHYDRSFLGY